MTLLPLGTNGCDACARVSGVYDLFPRCRDCQSACCPEHQAAGSFRGDDGRESCLCLDCAAVTVSPRKLAPPAPFGMSAEDLAYCASFWGTRCREAIRFGQDLEVVRTLAATAAFAGRLAMGEVSR